MKRVILASLLCFLTLLAGDDMFNVIEINTKTPINARRRSPVGVKELGILREWYQELGRSYEFRSSNGMVEFCNQNEADSKSDYFIVLWGRESRLQDCSAVMHGNHGEGNSGYTQHAKETSSSKIDWEYDANLKVWNSKDGAVKGTVRGDEYNRGARCDSFAR